MSDDVRRPFARIRAAFDHSLAWLLLTCIAAGVLTMLGLRAWLGSTDWAGLGQWVGGLGAFFAAGVALRIARDEAGRENRREAERLRVHAYYIVTGATGSIPQKGVQVWVRNTGKEPVTNVDVVAVHYGRDRQFVIPCAPVDGRRAVLLPDGTWNSWVDSTEDSLPAAMLVGQMDLIPIPEIRFDDLAGSRWQRLGEDPPVRSSS